MEITHVSDTAFMIAYYRAQESARAGALFRDPLAERLAGEKGKAVGEHWPTAGFTSWMVAVRTVIIDRYVMREVADGADVVLNLGAGLDARPYRLELPSDLLWIEADYASVIQYKERILADVQPQCRLERTAVDLEDDTARRSFLAAVAVRGHRILVLSEGVVPYLENDDVGKLADDLRALPQIDGWIVDYFEDVVRKYRKRAGLDRHLAQAPFKFRPGDWFAFFAQHGWRAREVRFTAEVARQLGRRPPFGLRTRVLGTLMRVFRPRALKRFGRLHGYVLLEPDAR